MTQLSILTASEQKKFDHPPVFNNDERYIYFGITPEIRLSLARIKTPTNKVGFLLQLGYFRANARFYQASMFYRRDISYIKRLLKLDDIDLTQYTDTVPRRHRQRVRSLLNWQNIDTAAHEELTSCAKRYVDNQEYPKKIFQGLIDLCWKRQWVIPTYHELNSIVTHCFNAADREIISKVEQVLTHEQVEYLEALLLPIQRSSSAGSTAPITQLKRIDQSLKAGNIRQSMKILILFRDHFRLLESALEEIPLSDKATDYYATWLVLADHQQLSQFPNRFKAYLHLIAFIKHQYYQRQDQAIDVLLKSVSGTQNLAKKSVNQYNQARKAERDLAIRALHQAQLTASQFANGVISISQSDDASASEKYYKIETLVDD